MSTTNTPPRILVIICSCLGYQDRNVRAANAAGCARKREACRSTWLVNAPEGVDYAFFVGGTPPADEPDVWGLDAPDTYHALPEKVRAAFVRALAVPGWEWLFKCDDDTYCHLPRLLDMVDALKPDPVIISAKLRVSDSAHGGAGYLLPRAMVQAVAKDPAFARGGTTLEDVHTTEAVRRKGGKLLKYETFQPFMQHEPQPANAIITCHKATPQDMLRIYARLEEGNMTVHQWWEGETMPAHMREWCAGVRAWAEGRGWKYRLWTAEETESMFKGEAATLILSRCREVLPTATTAGLSSDWWRYRILSEFGGLWLDTDYIVRDAKKLNAWKPTADLATMGEGWNSSLPSIGCLWCRGKRGHEAARIVCEAASEALQRILPLDAQDFATRYIQMVRRDVNRSGIAKNGIGPWRFRAEFLPRLQAAGYSYEVMTPEVCADRQTCATSALLHQGAGSWRETRKDWQELAGKAANLDVQTARPAWLKAQSSRALPPAISRPPATHDTRQEDSGDGLAIPAQARRIVIFSNVTRDFDPRALPLMDGDHCIHINYARQFLKVVDTPGVTHTLVVRRGTERVRKRVKWYDPPVHDGFGQVLHVADVRMRARRKWWRDYCQQHPRQCPSTGFICWQLAREAAPHLPIVLCGFAPGEHFGTPQWPGHAWAYEADSYARAGVCVVRPDAPGMNDGLHPRVATLVMVCSSQGNQARRDEARATWCKDVPPGMAVRFWCGAEDAPPADDSQGDDMVRLPGVSHASAALPAATIAALRWAVANWNFSRLFLCHDDTFTALDRLDRYTMPQGAAAVGNPDAYRRVIALHGGAGILMTREMAELIAYQKDRKAPSGADVLVSMMVQKCGGILAPDRRFSHNMARVPAPGNALITAHGCRAGDMVRIMEYLRQ